MSVCPFVRPELHIWVNKDEEEEEEVEEEEEEEKEEEEEGEEEEKVQGIWNQLFNRALTLLGNNEIWLKSNNTTGLRMHRVIHYKKMFISSILSLQLEHTLQCKLNV